MFLPLFYTNPFLSHADTRVATINKPKLSLAWLAEPCDDGWLNNPESKMCIKIFTTATNQEKAAESCDSYSAHLISVTTKDLHLWYSQQLTGIDPSVFNSDKLFMLLIFMSVWPPAACRGLHRVVYNALYVKLFRTMFFGSGFIGSGLIWSYFGWYFFTVCGS